MTQIYWVFLGGPIIGRLPPNESPHSIVCADSGARHAKSLGLMPNLVVGDLDSLSEQEVEELSLSGSTIERHPVDKDHSDFELALSRIPACGLSTVRFFGAHGGRQDYQLNNLQVAAAWRADRGNTLELCTIQNESDIGYLLHPGRNVIRVGSAARVSLIALSDRVSGVKTAGLHWPLRGATIHAHSSNTLSNRATEDTIEITYRDGKLLVVVASPQHQT